MEFICAYTKSKKQSIDFYYPLSQNGKIECGENSMPDQENTVSA